MKCGNDLNSLVSVNCLDFEASGATVFDDATG